MRHAYPRFVAPEVDCHDRALVRWLDQCGTADLQHRAVRDRVPQVEVAMDDDRR
ncbi:MAG: hypothetical protein QOF33_282, partial [Thermomicrobiales bacterium]|nr:hypothetical protein [Thermomicrobiales bacterium]